LKARLILGSGSPRRLELLAVLGIVPDAVRPPDIDEDPRKGNSRAPIARASPPRRSRRWRRSAEDVVLCADTTVALGRRIMGKPADAAEAEAFLRALSGRRHRVYTGVAVKRGDAGVGTRGRKPGEDEAAIASRDRRLPRHRRLAGQGGRIFDPGAGGAFIPWISGSHSAIVGLPLAETANLLTAAGYPGLERP
jgi:septum formation protein